MASFSDIAFLLIIFFILVTSLTKQLGFLSELPAGEQSQQKSEKTTTLNMRDGHMTLNDSPITMDELDNKLTGLNLAQAQGDKKIVLIEAVGQVSWQEYFEVMSKINAAGGVAGVVKEDK